MLNSKIKFLKNRLVHKNVMHSGIPQGQAISQISKAVVGGPAGPAMAGPLLLPEMVLAGPRFRPNMFLQGHFFSRFLLDLF